VSAIRLLLRLARELRYRPLAHLIGRRVRVDSLAGVELALAGLAGDVRWEANVHLEGALAKYGLVDARGAAPHAWLEHSGTLPGIATLRACGFVPARGERWEEHDLSDFGGANALLEQLVEDLGERRCICKLMLRDDIPDAEHQARLMKAKRGLRLPATYFPRTFEVVDACVTNSDFVWFARHFYL
jgi:hypothetical protein